MLVKSALIAHSLAGALAANTGPVPDGLGGLGPGLGQSQARGPTEPFELIYGILPHTMVHGSISAPATPVQYRNGAFVLVLDTLRLQSRNCYTVRRRLCFGALQRGLFKPMPQRKIYVWATH